ncbi:DNA-binding response regulator, OmpR family, containings REC and winged-helix [Nostoc flagelliforme CCNUN1]|uniref:DNA-binding response regulator, OmpR family, containings REC and winged-helix n=1 Tax=Nostoc flagelliforme CCNUN1 TaxID=2038116 RepID=A0A2K8SSP8_9NOSO|nr:response regulator [Nostoc flagelliforme]AUB38451.1 DNA-binding response regulator, OmpR family, containings REC and winged-helix [Nostoc flagelliforme CCNUN1]
MTAQLLNIDQPLQLHKVRRVLLVEDHYLNRMLLSDYLSYSGYNVQCLSEGSNFFSTIEKFEPDLMLLDLKLPDIDGYSLLQQVQQKPNLSKIPIIVVSAFAFKADQELALSLGARRYFVKPLKLKDLIIAIEEELTF